MLKEKRVLVSLLLFILFSISVNAKTDMILFTKDGKQYILDEESKKENNILISKSFKYKNTEIPISSVDSIRAGDAIYRTISYKNSIYMARLLFSGANEGYKIHYDAEKIILIKNSFKEEFVPIIKKNKVGAYNYLFPECFKKDSNLYKIKSAASDDDIIKEVTQKINCQQKEYVVYKKPMKKEIYLAPFGGIILYKPNVKSSIESSVFNYDKAKPSIGYTVGGRIGFILNNKLDISVFSAYSVGQANLSGQRISEFYAVKDTIQYKGVYNSKSIDFGVDFKYIILKSKLSPTISAGLYFSNKFENNTSYKYTSDNGLTYVNRVDDLAARAIGFNIGAGVNYLPVSRVRLFLDTGYKIGVGVFVPGTMKVSEGFFYATMGVGIKLNKWHIYCFF